MGRDQTISKKIWLANYPVIQPKLWPLFPGLEEAFEIRNEDPFHLYCTSKTPTFLRRNLFNPKEEFQFHKFKEEFLLELDRVVGEIYSRGRNPGRLRRGNWKNHLQNETLECPTCFANRERNTLLEQGRDSIQSWKVSQKLSPKVSQKTLEKLLLKNSKNCNLKEWRVQDNFQDTLRESNESLPIY